MATLDIPIIQSADDATESATGAVITTGNTVSNDLDNIDEWAGLRFQNITIPQGSVINSATLGVYILGTGSDEPDVTIFAQAVDNAPVFVNNASASISSRARTTASFNWSSLDLGVAGPNELAVSPNFASVVQEIINRPGWGSGNALVLLIRGSASTSRDLQFRLWDYTGPAGTDPTGTYAATLHLDYTAATSARKKKRLRRTGLIIGHRSGM